MDGTLCVLFQRIAHCVPSSDQISQKPHENVLLPPGSQSTHNAFSGKYICSQQPIHQQKKL